MRIILTFFLFLYSLLSYNQGIENDNRSNQAIGIGVRGFNDFFADYSYFLKPNKKLIAGVNATVRYASKKDRPFRWRTSYPKVFIDQGYGCSLQYLYKAKSKDTWRGLNLMYKKLNSGRIKEDDGFFSGSNTSDYREFREYFEHISLSYIEYYPATKRFFIFYEVGAKVLFGERKFSVTGGFTDRRASNAVTEFNRYAPHLRGGFYYLFTNR